MYSSLVIQDFLSSHNNALTAKPHTAPPTMEQLLSTVPATYNPQRALPLIISCADPRVIPESIFGIGVGQAVVIRNAGGDVQKALADTLAINHLVHFSDILVVRHTDCGTTFFQDEEIRAELKKKEGVSGELERKVDAMRFGEVEGKDGGMSDALKRDIEFLRGTPLLSTELRQRIAGFVYNLETGNLAEVK